MRYLILGGAGFIGSHLTEMLHTSSAYNDVMVVDNFITGDIKNLTAFDLPPTKVVCLDVRDAYFISKFREASNDFQPHCVFNLACPASPVHYQAKPIATLETNFMGTLNGLRLADIFGARFFQASTSEIYGNPEVHPQPESYWGNVNTWGERSCYDEGKRVAESLCYEFAKTGVDVRIARIFNTYGPRMAINDGRVVSNFIVQALRGEDITIYGTGEQTRSMCYIEDMLAGFVTVMSNDANDPVNLGNPQEVTMNELAHKVLTLTQSSSRIVYHPLPKDDPERRKPNITKAKSLGWHPKVPLENGLKSTIAYFRGKL